MIKFPFLFTANYNHYCFLLPEVSQILGEWHWDFFCLGVGFVGFWGAWLWFFVLFVWVFLVQGEFNDGIWYFLKKM